MPMTVPVPSPSFPLLALCRLAAVALQAAPVPPLFHLRVSLALGVHRGGGGGRTRGSGLDGRAGAVRANKGWIKLLPCFVVVLSGLCRSLTRHKLSSTLPADALC